MNAWAARRMIRSTRQQRSGTRAVVRKCRGACSGFADGASIHCFARFEAADRCNSPSRAAGAGGASSSSASNPRQVERRPDIAFRCPYRRALRVQRFEDSARREQLLRLSARSCRFRALCGVSADRRSPATSVDHRRIAADFKLPVSFHAACPRPLPPESESPSPRPSESRSPRSLER
jgi:hypothetical protein